MINLVSLSDVTRVLFSAWFECQLVDVLRQGTNPALVAVADDVRPGNYELGESFMRRLGYVYPVRNVDEADLNSDRRCYPPEYTLCEYEIGDEPGLSFTNYLYQGTEDELYYVMSCLPAYQNWTYSIYDHSEKKWYGAEQWYAHMQHAYGDVLLVDDDVDAEDDEDLDVPAEDVLDEDVPDIIDYLTMRGQSDGLSSGPSLDEEDAYYAECAGWWEGQRWQHPVQGQALVEQYAPFMPKKWQNQDNEPVYVMQDARYLVIAEGSVIVHDTAERFYAHCFELHAYGIPATCYCWADKEWSTPEQFEANLLRVIRYTGMSLAGVLEQLNIPF